MRVLFYEELNHIESVADDRTVEGDLSGLWKESDKKEQRERMRKGETELERERERGNEIERERKIENKREREKEGNLPTSGIE